MKLNFSVNNQTLSLSPAQKNLKLVADSRNYLVTKFLLQTGEWKKGDLIYALFTHNGKTYKQILGADANLDKNECYVPPEVIHAPGFTVSLYCGSRIPTNTVDIALAPSGYTEKIENQKATLSVMEQMNAYMQKYAMVCNAILQDCQKIKEEIKEEKENG